MTEISFHFNLEHRDDYVLGLLKTALKRDLVTVVLGEKSFLETLSEQLWSARAESFVGHCFHDTLAPVLAFSPIILTTDVMQLPPSARAAELLINCSPDVPQGFERFAKLLEMVTQAEKDKSDARIKWKYYSNRGYSIKKNDLALKMMTNTGVDSGN